MAYKRQYAPRADLLPLFKAIFGGEGALEEKDVTDSAGNVIKDTITGEPVKTTVPGKTNLFNRGDTQAAANRANQMRAAARSGLVTGIQLGKAETTEAVNRARGLSELAATRASLENTPEWLQSQSILLGNKGKAIANTREQTQAEADPWRVNEESIARNIANQRAQQELNLVTGTAPSTIRKAQADADIAEGQVGNKDIIVLPNGSVAVNLKTGAEVFNNPMEWNPYRAGGGNPMQRVLDLTTGQNAVPTMGVKSAATSGKIITVNGRQYLINQ